MKKLIKCVFACALLAAFVWCGTIIADRQRLNEELIRLHVVANSDSAEDQELKLQVRDAVITSLRQALADVQDTEQAKEYLQENLPKLQELANRTLDAAGSAQRAVVTLCREGFPTRRYDTFSLPAGIYEALRVTIGDGAGKNRIPVGRPIPAKEQMEHKQSSFLFHFFNYIIFLSKKTGGASACQDFFQLSQLVQKIEADLVRLFSCQGTG